MATNQQIQARDHVIESDLHDIQGVVLRPYGSYLYSRYEVLRFSSTEQGRNWLSEVVSGITTAVNLPKEERPKTAQNIAFTADGLTKLGLPMDTVKMFATEFQLGMHTRTEILGDQGDSDPKHWEVGGTADGQLPIHALLLLYGQSQDLLDDLTRTHEQLREKIGGIDLVFHQNGMRQLDSKEHFGFVDGGSQPFIKGLAAIADKTVPASKEGPEVKAGEFLLGYLNEYDLVPPSPTLPDSPQTAALPKIGNTAIARDFGANGTYVVYRKLYQDVAGFRKFVDENKPDILPENTKLAEGKEREWFASRLIGRWTSGVAVAQSPETDDIKLPKDKRNDFNFLQPEDLQGYTTPLGAHIRRANPRDVFGLDAGDQTMKEVNRHRMIRRGVPYGTRLEPDAPADDQDRGLVFLVINADIAVQYEFVQKWMNDPNFNGLYDNQDVFSHNRPETEGSKRTFYFTIQDEPLRKRYPLHTAFVKNKGGGYFFMPGINALHFLAGV